MKIAIVGLGIIGASFALSLKNNSDYIVYGLDIDKKTIEYALETKIIAKGSIDAIDILPYADVVLICLYPDLMADFVLKNKDYFKSGTLLMDVTGIKRDIIKKISTVKPDNCDFIFTHPMAGRESRGINYASADVYKGANFLIVPVDSNEQKNIDIVKKIACDCGFGNITEISADLHDKAIAFTSQLSHVIAVALVNSLKEEYNVSKVAGDSYRGITRIASINEDLWTELFLGNKDFLLDMISDFEVEIKKIKQAIKLGDSESLKELFRQSTKKKKLSEIN